MDENLTKFAKDDLGMDEVSFMKIIEFGMANK